MSDRYEQVDADEAVLMEQERRRDVAWVKGLLQRYPEGTALSAHDEAELRLCLVRQLMRRDAGYR